MPIVSSFANNAARAFGFGQKPLVYVGSTFGNFRAVTNLALPAGSAVGDLCLAVSGFQASGGSALPTGFTLVFDAVMTLQANQTYQYSYKILTAGDITNNYVTFAAQAGGTGDGQGILVYRNVTQAVYSASAETGGVTTCPATYVTTAGAKGVVGVCVDRDGYNASVTVTNLTKVGGPGAGAQYYSFVAGHSLSPVANSTVVTFGGLLTGFSQMTTLITLK